MDLVALIFSAPVTGWTACGIMSIYVVQTIARGVWIPEKTHVREIGIITESRDEWRNATREARKTIAVLIAAQGVTEDFFRKVSVHPESQIHLESLVQIALAEDPPDTPPREDTDATP